MKHVSTHSLNYHAKNFTQSPSDHSYKLSGGVRKVHKIWILLYDDVYHGRDYLAAVERGDITADDMMLLFSIDGAQLYESKQSDCWIAIWIILDHAPDGRYTKKCVLPGTF